MFFLKKPSLKFECMIVGGHLLSLNFTMFTENALKIIVLLGLLRLNPQE